ncbi:uncharacterized protein Triagg1_6156 [Trichoderma aggressivum f. europaeum]|uniref:Uncharacterized protein n=1 Tax=Trichoderma aggressivum f. europaeum TaxID=173218 RepID=A0AAE1LYY0_9HYPO|nr:hypothetical protein Triagg1_6156 [Trichoderma aggressivum f. europaeum]
MHKSAMLRGLSISRLGLAPLSLARLHRRISFLSTSMERLALVRNVVDALQFFRVSNDPCADILAMLFRPVAASTWKLLSSNISAAAHLVVSVYVYEYVFSWSVRGPSSITPRSGGGVDTLKGIVLQFSQPSSASHVLLSPIDRARYLHEQAERGWTSGDLSFASSTATSTCTSAVSIQHKDNNYSTTAYLVVLLGRCNYYLHSNMATLPPTHKALRFLVVFDLPLMTPVLDGSPPGHRYARPLASTLLVFEDPPCPLYYAINDHGLCNLLKSPLVQYANRPRATVMRSSADSI